MVSFLLPSLGSQLSRAGTIPCSQLVCIELALCKYHYEQKVNKQSYYPLYIQGETTGRSTYFTDGAEVGPRKIEHPCSQPGNFNLLGYVTSKKGSPLVTPSYPYMPRSLSKIKVNWYPKIVQTKRLKQIFKGGVKMTEE